MTHTHEISSAIEANPNRIAKLIEEPTIQHSAYYQRQKDDPLQAFGHHAATHNHPTQSREVERRPGYANSDPPEIDRPNRDEAIGIATMLYEAAPDEADTAILALHQHTAGLSSQNSEMLLGEDRRRSPRLTTRNRQIIDPHGLLKGIVARVIANLPKQYLRNISNLPILAAHQCKALGDRDPFQIFGYWHNILIEP
jgi:hypothetical protein